MWKITDPVAEDIKIEIGQPDTIELRNSVFNSNIYINSVPHATQKYQNVRVAQLNLTY